jgi:Flp pilus assembly secretin CpaC
VADFAHKTLTSNVTLRSGETVALGGYIQSSNRLNRKSVPTLSKIPLIGKLLNRDVDTTDKVEVVVFLTPKVLRKSSQVNFDVYSQKNRLSRRENMVSILDENFDTTKMGNRNSRRLKKKMSKNKVRPHAKASKEKTHSKEVVIQDEMRDIAACETSEEETRKEAIERLRSKYSN